MKRKTPMERILGTPGEEVKCAMFPSGTASFHVWHTKAKNGDRCLCGKVILRDHSKEPVNDHE